MAIEALNSSTHDFPRRYDVDHGGAVPWAKSAGSKRLRPAESEDEYLAVCLVMLARSATAEEESSPATAADGYRCSVCDKSFPSYQALGGHKASHRVKPPLAAAAPSCVSVLNPSGRVHECSVCHKAFPTGQALGGHKRRHYEGVIGGGGGKNRTAVARNIDLNLPPSPELQCDEEADSALPHLYD